MGNSAVETLLGAVVLVVAGMFLAFAYSTSSLHPVSGYEVTAKFERIDGVAVGSDVKLSGIKIGTVVDQRLDPDTFLAVVKLSIDSRLKLPVDSVAQVTSEGLLGSNFIALVPGGDDKTIPAGGEIQYTQPPINVIQLIGKYIFDPSAKGAESKPGEAPK